MLEEKNQEEKIISAAKEIFMRKGFKACTSREIAAQAGVNVALVNYYFRSKDKLFKLIFEQVSSEFLIPMTKVFSSDIPLIEKIKNFIKAEYDFLNKFPDIPFFIISELRNHENCGTDLMYKQIESTGILNEVFEAQENGHMRKIDFRSIALLLLSNCHYPVMSKNLLFEMHGLTEESYPKFIEIHKNTVVDMIIDYLFPN